MKIPQALSVKDIAGPGDLAEVFRGFRPAVIALDGTIRVEFKDALTVRLTSSHSPLCTLRALHVASSICTKITIMDYSSSIIMNSKFPKPPGRTSDDKGLQGEAH